MSVININMTNTVNNNYCKGRKKKMAKYTRIAFTAEAKSAAVNSEWSPEKIRELYPEALGTGFVFSYEKKGLFERIAYFGTSIDKDGDPCYLTKYLNEKCKNKVAHFWNPKQHNVFGVVLFEANITDDVEVEEAEQKVAYRRTKSKEEKKTVGRSKSVILAEMLALTSEIETLEAALALKQAQMDALMVELAN